MDGVSTFTKYLEHMKKISKNNFKHFKRLQLRNRSHLAHQRPRTKNNKQSINKPANKEYSQLQHQQSPNEKQIEHTLKNLKVDRVRSDCY